MSLRRNRNVHDDPASLIAEPVAGLDGVYSCRCRHCGRDYIAGSEAAVLKTVNGIVYSVACPRCHTPQREHELDQTLARLGRLQPDDPFDGLPKGHAA